MSKSNEQVYDEWQDLVNMTRKQLSDFLETEESQKVGQDSGDGESKGHKSGKRILEIMDKNKSDLDDDDYDHMGKVVGYIKRHKAQGGPDDDMEHSDWRYSLMNWGHDPKKD
jgi:hypothetical protein